MTEPTNVELRNALNRLRANEAGKGARSGWNSFNRGVPGTACSKSHQFR